MSHTDRHRPVWVQSVEHGTDEHHDHHLFGQPRTVRRKKRDSRGRVIMAMQPVRIHIKDAVVMRPSIFSTRAEATRLRSVRVAAQRLLDAGASPWERMDGPDSDLQPVMEDFVYGRWADHCTLGEPQRVGERLAGTADIYAPCGHDLEGEDYYKAFKRYPGERRAGIHRDWRRPSRRKVRNATRALAKDADTFLESDELDSGMYTR